MNINVERAVNTAQAMIDKAKALEKRNWISRQAEITEIRMLLSTGAAELSKLCTGLLLLARQQAPVDVQQPPEPEVTNDED